MRRLCARRLMASGRPQSAHSGIAHSTSLRSWSADTGSIRLFGSGPPSAFEVLGPRTLERVDPLAACPGARRARQFPPDFVVRHDEEVDVAVQVGVADGERALQVRPAEVAEDRSHARDQLVENGVQLGVDRWAGHAAPILRWAGGIR